MWTPVVANQVPKSENKKVDALSKIASTSFAHLTKKVLVEELKEKSINEAEVLAVVEEEGDTWMTPIYNYLTKETLPAEKEKARAVRRKSGRKRIFTKGRKTKQKQTKPSTDLERARKIEAKGTKRLKTVLKRQFPDRHDNVCAFNEVKTKSKSTPGYGIGKGVEKRTRNPIMIK
ncbi:hypothetical protein Tco_1306444 [Tanacetum coccineum]